MWSRMVRRAGGGWLLLIMSLILSPSAHGVIKRKQQTAYVADPAGIPLSKPSQVPAKVGSPASLIQPDRYEFYTFDESGELIKRLMTLAEIQEIIATGDGDDGHVLTIAQSDSSKPAVTFNFQPPSHTKVHTIVSNVQNVLKAEMEAQKTNPPKGTIFDTPDVSSSWSQILPAIFGNTGGSIAPDSLVSSHNGPETDVISTTYYYDVSTEPAGIVHETEETGPPFNFTNKIKPTGNIPDDLDQVVDSFSQAEDLMDEDISDYLSKTTDDAITNDFIKISTSTSTEVPQEKNTEKPSTTKIPLTTMSTTTTEKQATSTTIATSTTTTTSKSITTEKPKPTTQKFKTTEKIVLKQKPATERVTTEKYTILSRNKTAVSSTTKQPISNINKFKPVSTTIKPKIEVTTNKYNEPIPNQLSTQKIIELTTMKTTHVKISSTNLNKTQNNNKVNPVKTNIIFEPLINNNKTLDVKLHQKNNVSLSNLISTTYKPVSSSEQSKEKEHTTQKSTTTTQKENINKNTQPSINNNEKLKPKINVTETETKRPILSSVSIHNENKVGLYVQNQTNEPTTTEPSTTPKQPENTTKKITNYIKENSSSRPTTTGKDNIIFVKVEQISNLIKNKTSIDQNFKNKVEKVKVNETHLPEKAVSKLNYTSVEYDPVEKVTKPNKVVSTTKLPIHDLSESISDVISQIVGSSNPTLFPLFNLNSTNENLATKEGAEDSIIVTSNENIVKNQVNLQNNEAHYNNSNDDNKNITKLEPTSTTEQLTEQNNNENTTKFIQITSTEKENIKMPIKQEIKIPVKEELKTPLKEELKTTEKEELQTPTEELKTLEKEKSKTPGKEELKIPGKEELKIPGKEEFKIPGKEEFKIPGKEEFKIPEKEELKTPGKEELKTPEKEESLIPGNEELKIPEKEQLKVSEKEQLKTSEKVESDSKENIDYLLTSLAENEALTTISEIPPTTYKPTTLSIKEHSTLSNLQDQAQKTTNINKITITLGPSTVKVLPPVTTQRIQEIKTTSSPLMTTANVKRNTLSDQPLKISLITEKYQRDKISTTERIPITDIETTLSDTESTITQDDELMEMLNQYSEMFNLSPQLESKADDSQIKTFGNKKPTAYKKTDPIDDDEVLNITLINEEKSKNVSIHSEDKIETLNKNLTNYSNMDKVEISSIKRNNTATASKKDEVKRNNVTKNEEKGTEKLPIVHITKSAVGNIQPQVDIKIDNLPVYNTTISDDKNASVTNNLLRNETKTSPKTQSNDKSSNLAINKNELTISDITTEKNNESLSSQETHSKFTEATTQPVDIENNNKFIIIVNSEQESSNESEINTIKPESVTLQAILELNTTDKENFKSTKNGETSTLSSIPQTKAVDRVTITPQKRDESIEKIENIVKHIANINTVNVTILNEKLEENAIKNITNTWKLVPTVIPHNETEKTNASNNKLTGINNVPPFPYQRPQATESYNINKNSHLPNSQIRLPGINGGEGLEKTTSSLSEDVYQFTELCNELAFRYWDAVSSNGVDPKRSLVLSPFAATSILAMIFMGARGATSGEMNDILKLDEMVTFNPHIVFKNVTESIEVSKKSGVANSAFIRELYSDRVKGRLLTFYKDRVQQFYSGHVEEVNFNLIGDIVRRRTNLLVKRQTWSKITEYIKNNNMILRPPLSVFSANIFQTDCSVASTDGRDGEMYFVVSPTIRQRRLVPVPAVLYKSGFLAGYVTTLDATVVSLGKGDQIVSTILVMPGQQGSIAHGDDIVDLQNRLLDSAIKENSWRKILQALIPRPGLELQIPRFSHRSIINGSQALQKMGLRDLFDARKADLTGLNGQPNDLHLSDMILDNTFTTCGEGYIGEQHHVEIYPGESNKIQRRLWRTPHRPLVQDNLQSQVTGDLWEEPRDYQRGFNDPIYDTSYLMMPLHLRPRQARLPDITAETPRLKFDRPFMFFVRHNPTGLILHMGRYNPRLLP